MKLFKHTRIVTHNKASKSAAGLSSRLTRSMTEQSGEEVKALRTSPRKEESKYRGNSNRIAINWGCGSVDDHVSKSRILNLPELVNAVSNKLSFFQRMNGKCRTVLWTTDSKLAEEWVGSNARPDYPFALARTELRGHSGSGIVPLHSLEDLRKLKKGTLITKYQPKKSEWRLHLFKGKGVVFTQAKVRRQDMENPNWVVRNHENGFNYAHGEEYVRDVPKDVLAQAKLSFEASGLDFGAVDVIYNRGLNEAFVLEINSAPGLEGETLNVYTEQFLEVCKS